MAGSSKAESRAGIFTEAKHHAARISRHTQHRRVEIARLGFEKVERAPKVGRVIPNAPVGRYTHDDLGLLSCTRDVPSTRMDPIMGDPAPAR
jgi:hypothetical protein